MRGAKMRFSPSTIPAESCNGAAQYGELDFDEIATAVSADGLGNVYIAGSKFRDDRPNRAPSDVFLSKYDAAGNLQWTNQFGEAAEDERAAGVSADGMGNIYIAYNKQIGSDPDFQLGELRKYNEAGALLWSYQYSQGPVALGSIAGVSADGLGNVYISGSEPPLSVDSYVSKLNDSGTLLWTKGFPGWPGEDDPFSIHQSLGVSADGLGNAYGAGTR